MDPVGVLFAATTPSLLFGPVAPMTLPLAALSARPLRRTALASAAQCLSHVVGTVRGDVATNTITAALGGIRFRATSRLGAPAPTVCQGGAELRPHGQLRSS